VYIIDNGLQIEQGTFQYAWYHIATDRGDSFHRVVALRELYVITDDPLQRSMEGMLGKQWGAVRGLYNAGVNFLYAACGIFQQDYLGIVQLYGAAANGESRQLAARQAQADLRSVEATLAGYAQSKMRSPDPAILRWYMHFLTHCACPTVILGHPDPRVKRASSNRNGTPEEADDLALEQNEILFRGLAKLRQDFIFQVTNEHLPRRQLTENLVQITRLASAFASRQKGSKTIGFSLGLPIFNALSSSYTGSAGHSQSEGQSSADGVSHGWGNSHTESQAHTDSRSFTTGVAETWGESGSTARGTAHTNSQSHTESQSHSVSSGSSSNWSNSHSASVGQNIGLNGSPGGIGVGGGYTLSESFGASWGGGSFSSTTDTSGSADTTGSADTISMMKGEGWMHAVTKSQSYTSGSADTHGKADGASENWGLNHVTGETSATARSQNAGQSLSGGLTYGLSPAINIGQSWQTEDDLAARLTEILRSLEMLCAKASAEGGFATNAFLFTSPDGAAAAASLIPQAFHGTSAPTPVMTVHPREDETSDLIQHAQAFLPFLCHSNDPQDPFDGLLYWKYATLLPSDQVAAYTAPGLIQEGTLKVIAPIPDGIGFYPQMQGEVVLGHQYSPATAELTPAAVRLNKPRLMHTLFAGNTGYGKSVAAMRAVYEMALHWHMRIVVLDFGFAWRCLLNAPGIEDRVDIRQLRPDGVRPLRWNPLQIGTFINPETQLKAFADIFGTIAQLGQKQQQHRLLDAARGVYLKAGVLVDDPEVRRHATWGYVQADEADLIGAQPSTPLADLTSDQRQRLAVRRSSRVGLQDLYNDISGQFEALNPRDQVARGVLEGILWRLKSLVRGAPAAQFAPSSPGNEAVPVEDLGRPNGVVILEGGKFLDNFAKAWLLGWAGWLIYSDMVARRERQINQGEADLFMVYEEANIIFSGLDGGDADQKSGPSVSEQQSNMFRDSRKYGAFFGVVTQSPSLIPAGIRTSCNNLVAGFLTDPKDKDVVLSALARSEKGFHDEPWRRFISDEHIGMVIGRFPYTTSREQQMPLLFRPLMLTAPEPTDAEIEKRLGRIIL